MIDPLSLADEFPATSQQDWRQLVETALKGASFDEKLVTETYDGLRVDPLYPRAADAQRVLGRDAVPWHVVSRADHPDAKSANAEALHELENGASGLNLIFAGAPDARGFGVCADTADELDQTLSGVKLDAVALRIGTAPFAGRPISTLLTNVVRRRGFDPAMLTIDFGLDPLGDMARTGRAPSPWPQLSARAGATAADLEAKGFAQARFLRADGRAVHEAGGSEAQELAFALGCGVAYLRVLETAGFELDEARRRLSFFLAADADEFLTVAKFRALRKLWTRVEQACGLTPQPAFVAAETAWRMMTARDPHVNMLRTTVAIAAAGIGGADAITALPFTLALGLPDRFARRVARNTQLILLEESNLHRVADPAAGSGGIEHLTAELCKTAWARFQEIEAAGGAAAAIEQGLLQKEVAATHAEREANVARRKDALIGTSDYPNLAEAPAKVLDVPRVSVPPMPAAVTFEALPATRLAEPFEALRDAGDRMLEASGSRPKVFLANLGKLSDFTIRATFARNFYEAGGIEAVDSERFASSLSSGAESPHSGEGLTSPSALVAAFNASGARLACLCSSDKVYARAAVDAAKSLVSAGAIVHLAGKPGEHEDAWRKAGVDIFIYVGCDMLSTLQTAHDKLAGP